MPFKPGEIPEGATPFKPGESGNPAGKPPGTKNRSTLVKKWMEVVTKGENSLTNKSEELTEEEWQILSLIKQGRRGNIQASKLLFEMLYGPQEKNINHSGSISLEQITGMEVK